MKIKDCLISLKICLAYLTNNKNSKQYDVHGRSYKDVYKQFGRQAMMDEYKEANTWRIK